VLYDSGATHSFVSNECVRRLGLVMRELACDLIVATPIHHVCLCGMPYRGGRPQVQGQSHLLTNGGVRCHSGYGLVCQQPCGD